MPQVYGYVHLEKLTDLLLCLLWLASLPLFFFMVASVGPTSAVSVSAKVPLPILRN